jgi:lactate permease
MPISVITGDNMTNQAVSFIDFVLALSPIAAVLILMVGFKWGGAKAGAVGWLVALIVSLTYFGANTSLLAYAQTRGVLLTLYVLYIIWMALILFNVVKEAGAIEVIADGIVRLTGDRVLQLLILSWVFSAFLQGVAGFGVPIAVVAPLLIGLGFSPVTSVAAVAAGHSWSVTFGDIASSFNALIAATGLSGETLAPWSAILLGVACFGCGITAAYAYQGFSSVKRGWIAIVLVGGVMAVTQYLLAVNRLWNLAGFVAGLAGLAASALVARLAFYRHRREMDVETEPIDTSKPLSGGTKKSMPLLLAVTPYLILILIVAVAELITPVHEFINSTNLVMKFPETKTALGFITEAGTGKKISVFGHAGALLAYTSVAGYLVFSLTGHYKSGALGRIISNTTRSAVRSSIGIATMVGFATIMSMSGMTYTLAMGLSQVLEPIFPFLAPYIGLLGAFMTGSNTNSNVVFAALQQETATLLSLPVTIILAAQTTGGSLGSMLAPAKIIVGCSTAGLSGEEGQVLRRTIVYGVIITAVIGIVVWIAAA